MIASPGSSSATSFFPESGPTATAGLGSILPSQEESQGAEVSFLTFMLELITPAPDPGASPPFADKKLNRQMDAGAGQAVLGMLATTVSFSEPDIATIGHASPIDLMRQIPSASDRGDFLVSAIAVHGLIESAAPDSQTSSVLFAAADASSRVNTEPASPLAAGATEFGSDIMPGQTPVIAAPVMPASGEASDPLFDNNLDVGRSAEPIKEGLPGAAGSHSAEVQGHVKGGFGRTLSNAPGSNSEGFATVQRRREDANLVDTADAAGPADLDDRNGAVELAGASELSYASTKLHNEQLMPADLAEQVCHRLTAHLNQLRESGHVEVQMHLQPPELGHVKLHLVLDDGNLSVRFLVQNDDAKSALDNHLEQLRVRFTEMGFSMGEFDVRREGSSSNWQSPPESGGGGPWRPNGHSHGGNLRKTYPPLMNSTAMVDVLA